jgi:hypothetical protein
LTVKAANNGLTPSGLGAVWRTEKLWAKPSPSET